MQNPWSHRTYRPRIKGAILLGRQPTRARGLRQRVASLAIVGFFLTAALAMVDAEPAVGASPYSLSPAWAHFAGPAWIHGPSTAPCLGSSSAAITHVVLV